MIFFKHPKVIPRLNLKTAGNTIEHVTEFNFLGININQNITWKSHVTKTAIKISRVIGVLHTMCKFVIMFICFRSTAICFMKYLVSKVFCDLYPVIIDHTCDMHVVLF